MLTFHLPGNGGEKLLVSGILPVSHLSRFLQAHRPQGATQVVPLPPQPRLFCQPTCHHAIKQQGNLGYGGGIRWVLYPPIHHLAAGIPTSLFQLHPSNIFIGLGFIAIIATKVYFGNISNKCYLVNPIHANAGPAMIHKHRPHSMLKVNHSVQIKHQFMPSVLKGIVTRVHLFLHMLC
jgi:hypothetical protein